MSYFFSIDCQDGGPFLQLATWTTDAEDSTMLVFMSNHGADVLKNCPGWSCDGTFKTATTPFKQVN